MAHAKEDLTEIVRRRTRYPGGTLRLTWEGILASKEGRGGCGSSGAEKGDCNGGETHHECDNVKESGQIRKVEKSKDGEAKLE